MVRCADRQIRQAVELGARPPAADPAGGGRHPRSHRVPLHRDPEGLFPGPGHRAHSGDFRSCTLGFFRGDGAAPAGVGGRHPQGSRCREPLFLHRRRRYQPDAQHRPISDQSQTARSAPHLCQRRDPAARAGDARRRRHRALYAAGPGPNDRRDGKPIAIPVRARGRQPERVREVGPEIARALAADPADRGCRQQLCGEWSFRLHPDRPLHRRALWHHAGHRRQRALRFFWAAHRLDDFYPIEPIPGDPRGRPGSAAVVELVGLTLPAVIDGYEWAGSTFGDCPSPGADCATRDQSSRSVSVDDGVIQLGPRAHRWARQSMRSSGPSKKSACRRA